MKKLLLSLGILFAATCLRAGWNAAPPSSATAGDTVTINFQGYISYNPGYMPYYLVLWVQTPNGAWSSQVVGANPSNWIYSGNRSFTFTAASGSSVGTWNFDIRVAESTSGGSSPWGSPQGSASTNVASPIVPTTFSFSNLTFTYDGGMKTASVSPSPGNATYTADLTKGPGVGTYTVSATAYGGFSGSGSTTLTINPPPNNPPTVSWAINPSSAYVNQWFTVQARGDDPNGNISWVYVWKDGQPFAFSGFPNGYTRYSDNNAAMSTVPGTVTFMAKSGDAVGAESGYIYHTVNIINRLPMVTMSASSPSIEFGQAVTITATATDQDSNLAFHGILAINEANTDWYRSPSTDHSTGWGNHPTSTDFTAASYTSGSTSGGTSTRTVTHRPSYTGLPRTMTYHSNTHDGYVWASSDGANWAACVGYATVVVNKTTPDLNNWTNQYRLGKGKVVTPAPTLTFGATLTNHWSGSVVAPSGNPTFTVTNAYGPGASPGNNTAVNGETIFYPGSYSVRCYYPGDPNYNGVDVPKTFTVDNQRPTATMTIKGIGSGGTATAVINEPLTITVGGADADDQLRAVNLWVLSPAPGSIWQNITSSDTVAPGGMTENGVTNNAINSNGANVATLGPVNRTYSIPLRANGGGTGSYIFAARSIDVVGETTDPSQVIYVTVGRATQPTLTVVPALLTQPYGSTQSLSYSGGAGGGAISYSIAGQSAAGVATLTGNSLKANASSGWVDVKVTKDADTYDYNAATSATVRVTLGKAPLTITALPVHRAYGDPNPDPFPVGYSGWAPGESKDNVTITGLSVTTTATPATAAGTALITVSAATADNYSIIPVNGTLTIDRKHVTFTFPLPRTFFYKAGTSQEPVVARDVAEATWHYKPAVPNSQGAVYAYSAIAQNPYYFQVEATGNYEGEGECYWSIVCCEAEVHLTDLVQVYTGSPLEVTATSDKPPGLNVVVRYTKPSGTDTVPPVNAGSYHVEADVVEPENSSYEVWGGHTDGTFTINQADQAPLTLLPLTTPALGYHQELTLSTPVSPDANSGSGDGAVSYTVEASSPDAVFVLSGNKLTANSSVGWVRIRATKGTDTNGNYKPATSQNTLLVNFQKGDQATLLFNPVTSQAYTTDQYLAPVVSGGSNGAAVSFAVVDQSATGGAYFLVGDKLTADNGYGSVKVRATRAGDSNYHSVSADATITFVKKTLEVTLGGLHQVYDTAPKPITASTTVNDLTFDFTYGWPAGPSSTAPTSAGTYNVLAVINDLDYQGQAGDILTVAKALPTISWTPAALTFGEPLGLAQLNATASIAGPVGVGPIALTGGTFTYHPDAGVRLGGGPQPLTVDFNASPADSLNIELYASGSATLTVNRATPVGAMYPAVRTISTSGSTYLVRLADFSADFWHPDQTAREAGVAPPSPQTLTYGVLGGGPVTGGTLLNSPATITIQAIYPGDQNYTSGSATAVWTLTSSPTDTGETELRVHRPN